MVQLCGSSLASLRGMSEEHMPGMKKIAHMNEVVFQEVGSSESLNDGCPHNLDSFLLSVSPAVACSVVDKEKTKSGEHYLTSKTSGTTPFLYFSDLWNSYEEWSFYGCGVHLSMPEKESATQYFVPYLSALQIYGGNHLKKVEFLRVKGNEGSGDWEADFKDSSSEASEFDGCRLAGSDSSSELGSDTGSLLDENLGNRTTGVCPGCKEKKKLFEYTEKGPPYCRVPLLEKVQEFGEEFPWLKTLRSSDVHPCSWFSVAWYPLYRIPPGASMRDFGACFLTFHALSTSAEDLCKACSKKYWISSNPSNKISNNFLRLEPFGLMPHKLKSNLWLESEESKEKLTLLQSQAQKWLDQMRFYHHDFEFFRSHAFWQ